MTNSKFFNTLVDKDQLIKQKKLLQLQCRKAAITIAELQTSIEQLKKTQDFLNDELQVKNLQIENLKAKK